MGKKPEAVKITGNNAKGNETLTINSGTAVGLASIPSGATQVLITTETEDIRYWIDGSLPTAFAGHLVVAGSMIELDTSDQLTKFKAIAVSGTATLQISYF
ncbi:hypothetical protein [Gorillibacterium sp. sgz5001074]|uniref:hypothetical protein n=1 Tax=Gorillibacterium sp. sgz5001074 TaxID=3446695 RepID=UPI003F67E88A